MQSLHVLAQLFAAPELGYLTHQQRDAVIEALMLTIVPPGCTSEADRTSLRRELLHLPWAWEPCDTSADGLVDRSGVRLARVDHPAALEPLGRALAQRLRASRRRDAVYGIMVALALADGGSERELAALDPVRRSLSVPPARARAIVEELSGRLSL